MVSKIRGTQDFLDLILFNFIVDTTKKYLMCHHFTEIATPILESTELFKRSLGLETDVVTKQMFTIATQKEEELMCLRPEATASTMRAFLEHSIQTFPWKVFSWGPMFRYERPQKGRFRQFHQINMEIINTPSTWYDAYLITLLDRLFSQRFQLQNYALLINFLGCQADRQRFKTVLEAYLNSVKHNLCETCLVRKEKNILRVFDCKNSVCQEQYRNAPKIADHVCTECAQEWKQVQETLQELSVTFSVEPTLVRGLDYYDKTAFEFVSTELGAQSAFCGGGRYNHLAGQLGSKTEYPALGASIGIERLMLLLEPLKNILPLPQQPGIQVVVPMGPEQQNLALFIADELQNNGLCTDVLLDGGSLKSMLRKANKIGAQHVLIIGQEEQETGTVMVKNMQTGAEERIAQTALVAYLKR
jgi:histidyl-tRNA synthetase